jgi:hypothetical protein
MAKKQLPATNMIVLGPGTRTPPRAGDLFVCNMRGERWVAGRVVHTNCRMMSREDGHEPLLYFYRMDVDDPMKLRPPFRPDLLIPPEITNFLGWKYGYFKTIGNYPMNPEERLPRHYFMLSLNPIQWGDPEAVYCDEFYDKSPQPGKYNIGRGSGLASYRGIDDCLSEALGIPLVPDEDAKATAISARRIAMSRVAARAGGVIIYVPLRDGYDPSNLEASIETAVREAKVGSWEGHGTDLERNLHDIRFEGDNARSLAQLIRRVIQGSDLQIPDGWYMTIRYDEDDEEIRIND